MEGNPNEYFGKDCSLRSCKNDCGNVEGEDPIGECIQDFPFAYCRCFEENKRGGDDCSKIFCLNDCAKNGICQEDGTCECEETFFGEDCSIQVLPVMYEAGANRLWKVIGAMAVSLAVLALVGSEWL